MTTTTMPQGETWGGLELLGRLAELLAKPVSWLFGRPKMARLQAVIELVNAEFSPAIMSAVDADDLQDIITDLANMPAFDEVIQVLLAFPRGNFEQLDRPAVVGLARSILEPAADAHRQDLARLLWAFHELTPKLPKVTTDDVEAFLSCSRSAAHDLACPPQLARALASPKRINVAMLALATTGGSAQPTWRVAALAEMLCDDLRLGLSLMVTDMPREHAAEAEALLRSVGVEPAPMAEWTSEYEQNVAAIRKQIADAEAGNRRPFA